MSFTAKVKKTGKIFEATDELGENDIRAWDAKALEEGKRYKGYLYDTQPTDDPAEFKYRGRIEKTFDADELEQLPLPVVLRDRRKRR
jgi:hypothetical protein